MVQEFLQTCYDSQHKIWTSLPYTHNNEINETLGEKFLKTMRTIDCNKIIDHFYDTNRQKTAKEVYEQSIIVAINLQRLGIKKGDIVVFYCGNNENVLVLTMGCVLIGAIVNFFEVHLEEDHVDIVFDILKPSMILCEEQYKEKSLKSLKRINHNSYKHILSIDGQDSQFNIENQLLKYDDDAPINFDKFHSVEIEDPQNEVAFLLLTSGSTGTPKIVQATHALIIHGCEIWWNNKYNYEPLNKDSVIFSFSPLRWISQAHTIFNAILKGIKRVSSNKMATGKHGFELLRTCQLTHLFAAPSILHNVLQQIDANDKESLKSIKLVQLGGESPSKTVIDLARKHCINAKILRCYGMTEMCSCIASDEHINSGRLLPGYQLQILDDKYKALGVNVKGQIALKPLYPLKGYKGIDCKKYYNENNFFINGDYGFMDDEQNLHLLARYKDLIRSNDLVLIPNTIEDIIMTLEEIYLARLAGYHQFSEDVNEIAALFVVLQPAVTTARPEISNKILHLLKNHLKPEELDVLKEIYYVDSIPVTTCGKVDRVALKNLALRKSQIN